MPHNENNTNANLKKKNLKRIQSNYVGTFVGTIKGMKRFLQHLVLALPTPVQTPSPEKDLSPGKPHQCT